MSSEGSSAPTLVVVAGSGRSGTSTIAGALKLLGLAIPQPEIPGNRTNPRGHFEPEWAVAFQRRLLMRSGVRLTDARPQAFDRAAEVARDETVRKELDDWLADQLVFSDEVVVKDPRSSWFLGMWREAGQAAGARPAFLTMLRHPTEVVGSKDQYYEGQSLGTTVRTAQTTRLASWVNVSLFTEEPTRDTPRVFVRYTDLLTDWRGTVATVAEGLDLSLRQGIDDDRAKVVDEFIDPDLRRVRTTWDEIDVPTPLRDLAEETWQHLNRLADSGGQDDEAQAGLDRARATYRELYYDAEALAQSSVEAAARSARAARRRQGSGHPPGPESAPTPRQRVATVARRAVDRTRRAAGRGGQTAR